MPNPPALHAAATSSGPVRSGPIGATTIGASIANRSQNRVRSMSQSSSYESKMGAIGLTMQLRPQIGSGARLLLCDEELAAAAVDLGQVVCVEAATQRNSLPFASGCPDARRVSR